MIKCLEIYFIDETALKVRFKACYQCSYLFSSFPKNDAFGKLLRLITYSEILRFKALLVCFWSKRFETFAQYFSCFYYCYKGFWIYSPYMHF